MTTQTIAIPTLSVVEAPARLVLCFSTQASLLTLANFNDVPGQLYDEAARLGITVAGPIQYVYAGVSGDPTNEFALTIALPIREQEPGTLPDGFTYQTLPAFRAASFTYEGAWDSFPEMYDALFPAFYAQGHTYTGNLREVYTVADLDLPERCVTDILVGVSM